MLGKALISKKCWLGPSGSASTALFFYHTREEDAFQRGPESPGEPPEWGSRDWCDNHKDKSQIKHGNTSDIKMYIFIAGRIISFEGLPALGYQWQELLLGLWPAPATLHSGSFWDSQWEAAPSPSHWAWSTASNLSSASSAFSCSKGSLEWLGSALESSRQGREEMHSAISACTFCRSRVYFSWSSNKTPNCQSATHRALFLHSECAI